MPRLAAMLAITTGKQKKLCEDFLRELFRIVAEELEHGENVKIKGFGTFKLIAVEARKSVNVATGEDHEIPGHKKVIFVPAKELASIVNEAFSAFEAVEIADDLTTDSLDGDAEAAAACVDAPAEEMDDEASAEAYATQQAPEDLPYISGTPAQEQPEEPTEEEPEQPTEEQPEEPIEEEPEQPTEEQAEEMSEEKQDVPEPDDDVRPVTRDITLFYSDEEEEPTPKGHKFGWGFFAGFMTAVMAAGLALLVAYFAGIAWFAKDAEAIEGYDIAVAGQVADVDSSVANVGEVSEAENIVTEAAPEKEEEESVPTKPSDQPVYDTVSTTRYLTTIAKEHYGNFNLWPIIYEENKDILGHPDRIRPGTRVVVPSLSKYGIDPKNPEHIKEVKRKGIEIYSRYR